MDDSPYLGKSFEQWGDVTAELMKKHPLDHEEIVDVVLQSWRDIFNSKLGPKEFQIGRDIYPQPQIMAFLLHELIPLELASRHAKEWRRDQFGTDKDLVYVVDEQFSIEIRPHPAPTAYLEIGVMPSQRKATRRANLAIISR